MQSDPTPTAFVLVPADIFWDMLRLLMHPPILEKYIKAGDKVDMDVVVPLCGQSLKDVKE